ncbi:MAG TPA: hypothetical protein VGE24_16880 [Emticicia sp.]
MIKYFLRILIGIGFVTITGLIILFYPTIYLILTRVYKYKPDTVNAYYEPKKGIMPMDQEIDYLKVNLWSYNLINNHLSENQIKRLNSLISDKSLREYGELGTCEISGILILKDKVIYTVCGSAEVFVCREHTRETILLNEKGYELLFNLIKEIRKNSKT